MVRATIQTGVALAIAMSVLAGCNREDAQKTGSIPSTAAAQNLEKGEALFKQYCSPCHPDGGNTSDPQRTLHGSALQANHVTRTEDIVRIMRTPISRMIRFDATIISDRDATAIAEYVLTAFK